MGGKIMTQSVIGALRVNLGLDSAKFEKGARGVKSPLTQMRQQFLAVSAVVVGFGAALSSAALAGARDIDKAAKSARRLSASIGGFRALELAAGEAGVSLSALTNDVQTIDREIASIGKSGNAQRALKALNLEVSDLAGLDADEKLAVIADQVKSLGLGSGETASVLRDLGVRNREMVLLVGQGGDALRRARQDVEEYGLALSGPAAASIERANDQLGRLGLVGQYLGQQLALEIVPALGAMAEGLTNSLRAGGLLRSVIDGLVGGLDNVAAYAAVAAAGFGVRFVGALVLSKAATLSLSGALGVLRVALLRTGIGVLIVGAGELALWFSKLVDASGGLQEAFKAVFNVGKSVFLGVGNTAWGLMDILAGVASAIAGGFVRAFAEIAKAWDLVVNGMSSAWNSLADSRFGEALGMGSLGQSDLSGTIKAVADGLLEGAVDSIKSGGRKIADASKSVAEAIGTLRIEIGSAEAAAVGGEQAASQFSDALAGVSGSAGNAAASVKKIKPEVDKLVDGLVDVKRSARTAFSGLVTGAMSAKKALSQVLNSFAIMLSNRVFDSLFAPVFDGLFDSGGAISAGKIGIVGERGPELVRGPAQVTSRADTARIMQAGRAGGGGTLTLNLQTDSSIIAQIAENTTGMMIQQNNQSMNDGFNQRSNQYRQDPRRKGAQ